MKNTENPNNLNSNISHKNYELTLFNSLFPLLIIFSISIIIRLYYLPFDLPLILDAQGYFWYANDMSILKQIPIDYSPHNNLWPAFLSLFFSINESNNILDYMNMQRFLSTIISALTIFPVFFLCKNFFSNKYSLLGASFFIFEPRLIMNSLQGITEPIYLLIGILIITFSLSSNKKLFYLSFGLTAIFSLIRYEGLLLLLPLTITYFWKFKINKKSILKYILCFSIFLLIILPITNAKIQATGEDGLFSHFLDAPEVISETYTGKEIAEDRFQINNGIKNFLSFLGWITIPIWIIFLPYGILKYFQKFDQNQKILLLFSVILIIPAFYVYSRDMQETRYLYILFPIFSIISLYSIKKIDKIKNTKLIPSLIIIGIIFSSICWLEYKWIDEEYEKEVFLHSLKIKELTQGINNFYPESEYLEFINSDQTYPQLKNQIYDEHYIFNKNGDYNEIKELLLNGKENGLTHIIIDESQKPNNLRKQFLIEIFENENKYNFLTKIYDSNDEGFNYKMKIFEINYSLFDEYIKIFKN